MALTKGEARLLSEVFALFEAENELEHRKVAKVRAADRLYRKIVDEMGTGGRMVVNPDPLKVTSNA